MLTNEMFDPMNLAMTPNVAAGYHSQSQIARRVTEEWGHRNLYCVSCTDDRLLPTPPNTKAFDFRCSGCDAHYQLKAGRQWSETRIPDAGFESMMSAIRNDLTPHLLVMQYTPEWRVSNLMMVPSFFFTASAIEKRRPLREGARRAGWVGCNILLSSIAPDGKIRLVIDGSVIGAASVRRLYRRIRPLATMRNEVRG